MGQNIACMHVLSFDLHYAIAKVTIEKTFDNQKNLIFKNKIYSEHTNKNNGTLKKFHWQYDFD